MYGLFIHPQVDRVFKKLSSKNKSQMIIIAKKLIEIRSNPNHEYKSLKPPLHGFKRIHIDKHFVLIFKINHLTKNVEVYHYSHHDDAYDWLPKD